MAKFRHRGVVLVIVIGTIIIVVILASAILSIITNQSRLSGHQTSRIQAYYAAMAGINYAYDRLASGDVNWPMPTAGNPYYGRGICRTATTVIPGGIACNVVDGSFPVRVPYILIAVAGNGTPSFNFGAGPSFSDCTTSSQSCIYAFVDYVVTP